MQVNEILSRLPAVQHWIDERLARNRSNAVRVSTLPFERLKYFYSAGTLERAWCVVIDEVPVPPLSRLGLPGFEEFERASPQGITYQDLYFVRRDQANDEGLHFHELVHTIQWRQLGPEKFLEAYALGYLNAGGYGDNPFEQIAYQLQDEFLRGTREFQAEPLVLKHLRGIAGGSSK
jgi:hypothetical protein